MKKSLLILLLTFGFYMVWAQTIPLYQAQIEEDIDIFVAALEEGHPGLDIHDTRSTINALCEQLKENQTEQELKDFYLSLLQIIAAIGDGHTNIEEGKLYREAYPYLASTMPFEFVIVDEEIYLSKSYDDAIDVPLFSQLVAVNGKSASQILETLYSLTPADGNNARFKESYNEKILSRQFAKLIEFSEVYEMELQYPTDSIKVIQVNGIHDSLLHSRHDDKRPLTFELNEPENYALLTVNTFQYSLIREGGIDFHKFIEQSFKELRKSKVDNLIIDIRENYGGDNILAITLYAYLTEGQFRAMNPSLTQLYDIISVSQYSNFPAANYPYLSTHEVIPQGNGTYELKNGIDSKTSYDSDFIYKGPNQKAQNIAKNKCKGTIYCLTSGLTFSAAANFATLLSRHKNALFIGEETGGASGYYCGGGFYTVTLPHSQFILHIPFMRRCVAGAEHGEKGQGVIPDYPIGKDVKRMEKAADVGLLKAKALIKSHTP